MMAASQVIPAKTLVASAHSVPGRMTLPNLKNMGVPLQMIVQIGLFIQLL